MRAEIIHLGDGLEVHYYREWISNTDYALAQAELLPFTEEIVTMYGRPNVIRRRTVNFGLPYSYNPTAKKSTPWEGVAVEFGNQLDRQFAIDFSQCAGNEYVDGEAYIGPHHDKATVVGRERREPLYIACASLGITRPMVFIPPGAYLKGIQPTVKGLSAIPGSRVLELAPGSLVLMSNSVNRVWKHSIPRDPSATGKRISLTYRHF